MSCPNTSPDGLACIAEGAHKECFSLDNATLAYTYWDNPNFVPAPASVTASHPSRGMGRGFRSYVPSHTPEQYVEAVGAVIESANVIHFRRTDVQPDVQPALAALVRSLADQLAARGVQVEVPPELSDLYSSITMNTSPEQLHRHDGPSTSAKAAKSVSLRSGTQKMKLLLAFADARDGLTDEEAARIAGLLELRNACWWHRASDLRADELIEATDVERRSPTTNEMRRVSVITARGLSIVNKERSKS